VDEPKLPLLKKTENNLFCNFYKLSSKKLLFRTDKVIKQQAFNLQYRLAELLLIICADDTYEERHIEIAEYLGVSYRHLLHTFTQFKEKELITQQNGKLKIDREKIKEFLQIQ
jgi:CRP-like cAMP-binding protein